MTKAMALTISVVVPSFRRPSALRRCLDGLSALVRPADQIIVVAHESDGETQELVRSRITTDSLMFMAVVNKRGQVAACNAGLQAALGDIVAIIDDDTVPRPDWLAGIERHFLSDTGIGGVGGPDRIHHAGNVLASSPVSVGNVRWFGRVIGNHHLGVGEPRRVDVLKGANMSYRRAALPSHGFDERLRGAGVEMHNDLMLSLTIRRLGWQLIYDPAIVVDHYPAPRDGAQRDDSNPLAIADIVHNETLAVLEFLTPVQRPLYLLWAFLIGSRGAYGLAQCARFLLHDRGAVVQKLIGASRGRLLGLRTWRQSSRMRSHHKPP